MPYPLCYVSLTDSQVRHEVPEEGRIAYRPKRCDYNNKDEVNSQKILSNNKQKVLLHF